VQKAALPKVTSLNLDVSQIKSSDGEDYDYDDDGDKRLMKRSSVKERQKRDVSPINPMLNKRNATFGVDNEAASPVSSNLNQSAVSMKSVNMFGNPVLNAN